MLDRSRVTRITQSGRADRRARIDYGLRMRLLLRLAVVLGVAAFVLLGLADPDVPRHCPCCGLDAALPVYRGAFGGPTHLRCHQCGAALRERDDGSLAPL